MSVQKKAFKPGSYIFREGYPAQSLFLVQKGTVSIRKRTQQGEIELARVYSNEVLGELAYFDRSNRSASAFVLTDVEVLEIDFASLDKMYATVPDYFKTIIAALAERLRRADEAIRQLKREYVESGEIAEEAPTAEESAGESSDSEKGEDESGS